MANNLNPLPVIAVLFLLKNSGNLRLRIPSVSALQLEAMLDNAHSMLHTLEKLSSFAQNSSQVSLPDMKKMMEIVEKIPL